MFGAGFGEACEFQERSSALSGVCAAFAPSQASVDAEDVVPGDILEVKVGDKAGKLAPLNPEAPNPRAGRVGKRSWIRACPV